jgi:hypothetical protein
MVPLRLLHSVTGLGGSKGKVDGLVREIMALIDIDKHRGLRAQSLPRISPENVRAKCEDLQVSSSSAEVVNGNGSIAGMPHAWSDMKISVSVGSQPSANWNEDSKWNDERFSLASMAYSMTPSIIPSVRSSTADLQSTGMIEPPGTYTALSRRQQSVLSYNGET